MPASSSCVPIPTPLDLVIFTKMHLYVMIVSLGPHFFNLSRGEKENKIYVYMHLQLLAFHYYYFFFLLTRWK